MVPVEVEANELAGMKGRVGMVAGAYVPSCGDQQIDKVGCRFQAHTCPREVRKKDKGVVGGVL